MFLRDIYIRTRFGITRREDKQSRRKMRTIFNYFVKNKDEYTLICCRTKTITDAVIVNSPHYDTFIVGYKDSDEKALLIIPVSSDFKEIQQPIVFTKRNGAEINFSKFGNCNAQDSTCSLSLEVILYKRKDKKSIAIIQSDKEKQAFLTFFKNGL